MVAQISRGGISRSCHCKCPDSLDRLTGVPCSAAKSNYRSIPFGVSLELFKKPPISLEEEKEPLVPRKRQRSEDDPGQENEVQSSTTSPYILVDPTDSQYATRFCSDAIAQLTKRMDLGANPTLV